MMPDATIKTVAQWYGSNRMLAPIVAAELKGCSHVSVPFAGGMSEVLEMTASSIVVNDLHRHVINLASVCAHERLGPRLYRRLRRFGFDPDRLRDAQVYCETFRPGVNDPDEVRLNNATMYFVATWMNRAAKAGTDDEFKGNLPVRWTASGGDSAVRYQSAVSSIVAWRRTLRRCNFTVLDAFEFLDLVHDDETCGIYVDAPFPGPGDKYRHKFSEQSHVRLRDKLQTFKKTRVVIRYYDVPLVRGLYGQPRWVWRCLEGRKQSNAVGPEVLLINGPSRVAPKGLLG